MLAFSTELQWLVMISKIFKLASRYLQGKKDSTQELASGLLVGQDGLLGEICFAALFVDKKGVKVGTKRFGLLAAHTAFDSKFPGLVVDSDQA